MQFGEQEKTETNSEQSLGRISYEMRTRLNSMIGFLLLLLENSTENLQQNQELLEESYKSAWKILSFIDVFEDISSLRKNWQLVSAVGETSGEVTQQQELNNISKDFRNNTESILSLLSSLINKKEEDTQSQDEIISQAYQSALDLLNELKNFEDGIKA